MSNRLIVRERPFAGKFKCYAIKEGQTIEQMIQQVPDLPTHFQKYGVVCIDGVDLPRALWKYTRPKPQVLHVQVTLGLRMQGGGGGLDQSGAGSSGGGKSILTTILSIAVIAASLWVGAGGLAG